MAPGLNGRQTGTVPKNKPRSSGSQSHRSTRDALIHFASLDWEPVSDPANRPRSRRKSSTAHSETEADSLRYDVSRSRSSTMTSQQHLVDNDNGEISWLNGSEDGGHHSLSNASSRQSSHRGRQHNTWPNHQNSNLQNGESLSSSNSVNIPDRKQVINKLAVIQDYIQQTASLMNTLKASDTPTSRNQYEKLSTVLDDLRDSEGKLNALLNNMDRTESRIDDLLADIESNQFCQENVGSRRMQKFNQIINEHYGPITSTNMGNNHSSNNNVVDANEDEELIRKSEDSKKKVEALERRKQELIDLHEKAKRQLQEAQAEEGRLMASANSLNQELHASKLMEQNLQQLSQRLHNIQQVYKTKNQIKENLAVDDREEAERPDEDQAELSDTETDYQLVADKMAELNALKAQLNQIQRTMAAIQPEQNGDEASGISRDMTEAKKDHFIQQNRNEPANFEQNVTANAIKLEQAKTKLSQLNQLLELIQNSSGLSPAYMQRVSNLLKDEGGSSSHSPSPSCSGRSQPRPSEDISIETMQMMTRELEERTAAMKEERDKLIAARQHLQRVAGKIPLTKTETESLSPDEDSESEAPCLLPSGLDSSGREGLNATLSTETEQNQSCSENSPYICRTGPSRNRQRASWNTSLPTLPSASQERRCKNETLSRASNQSSVHGSSRNRHRDPGRWSPSPAASFCENPALRTQSQLEMTNNLCEQMLADSMNRGQQLSIDELFTQHQMLTKTVAQCSQLLWLQQKQITELRNAVMLNHLPMLPNSQSAPSQSQVNVPLPNNQSPFPSSLPLYTMQPQNFVSPNQKLNAGDVQNAQVPHDFQDFYHPGLNFPFPVPDGFHYDGRYGNFNRFNPQQINPSASNLNQNQPAPGLNNRVPTGINCIGPEDSGALNNQVPPGNRANNYWDNFRSYSRQNLLSNTKSNEETDTSRRVLTSNQERIPREGVTSLAAQNNPSASSQTNAEASGTGDQYLLPVNSRSNPSQITRSRSVEPQNLRNTVKNESRNQENDSRMKNETTGARLRNPEQPGENIRNVRNDVGQPSRNVDHTRNFVHLGSFDNEEAAQGNNKKRVEKSRCRNETRNLNSRSDINNGLFLVLRDNVYSEVTNFIRANENRPHFLIQLFRDLQQVTTDSLRQRTLESIEETVNANNLTERTNSNGANVNLIENRNNIRENRSNLNRNQPEDHARIDELFYHLRENQNTIRQNIGTANFQFSGNNLENPNISNIRDLGNSRNNLENEGLRDLRTYFEANLCNFGHNSALENPNLSNIRENLTRRGPISDYENINPKNVYLSMYDNIVEDLRRRNQESASNPQFVAPFGNFRNFEEENHYIPNESNRPSNNFSMGSLPTLDNNFEVREENEFSTDNRSRFGILDRSDNFLNGRDFITNGNNDSGIDINFNTEDRKTNYSNSAEGCMGNLLQKKNEPINDEEEGAVALMPSDWERNSLDNNSFISSLSLTRYDMSSFSDTVCEKSSFVNCSPLQQSDNGDLAEADQSRNEETSGAESDSGFVNLKTVETESSFAIDQNPETAPESNFSIVQTETENNFPEINATEPEGNFIFQNSTSEPEGNFIHENADFQWNENSEAIFSSESELGVHKHAKKKNEVKKSETNGDFKKGPVKNLTNKFRDNTFKVENSNIEETERQKTETDENKDQGEASGGSFSPLQNFQFPPSDSDRGNASPEAEADWEMENGLDQVPTRLEKNESPRKPA